jgi:hypothetical protein
MPPAGSGDTRGPTRDTALSPDGGHIAVTTTGRNGVVFDLDTGKRAFGLRTGGDALVSLPVSWSQTADTSPRRAPTAAHGSGTPKRGDCDSP